MLLAVSMVGRELLLMYVIHPGASLSEAATFSHPQRERVRARVALI